MLARMTKPCVELISVPQAAARLGVRRQTVARWVTRGYLVGHQDPFTKRIGVEVPSVEAAAAQRVRVS
jgi:predicted site-specific integrase-resolvase